MNTNAGIKTLLIFKDRRSVIKAENKGKENKDTAAPHPPHAHSEKKVNFSVFFCCLVFRLCKGRTRILREKKEKKGERGVGLYLGFDTPPPPPKKKRRKNKIK